METLHSEAINCILSLGSHYISGSKDGTVQKPSRSLIVRMHRRNRSRSDSVAEKKKEITCLGKILVHKSFLILSGNSSGGLCMWDEDLNLLAEGKLRHPISNICQMESSFLISSFKDIFLVERRGNEIHTQCVIEKAHSNFVQCMMTVNVASLKEIWSTDAFGDIRIWNSESFILKRALVHPDKENGRIFSMELVVIKTKPTVWIGCDSEILIYDARKKVIIRSLRMPKQGDVHAIKKCAEQQKVFVLLRQKGGKCSCCVWKIE